MYFAFHYNLNISLVSTVITGLTVINLICFHKGNTDPLNRPSGSFLNTPINIKSTFYLIRNQLYA